MVPGMPEDISRPKSPQTCVEVGMAYSLWRGPSGFNSHTLDFIWHTPRCKLNNTQASSSLLISINEELSTFCLSSVLSVPSAIVGLTNEINDEQTCYDLLVLNHH